MFNLRLTQEAHNQYTHLKQHKGFQKRYKAVQKALQFLKHNPRHSSLQTHKFSSLQGPNGEKIFEAYAEQDTPAAYRIFWLYGPEKKQITIVSITPHP